MNEEKGSNKKFDLEERTSVFGESVIKLVQKLPRTTVHQAIVGQLVRSGTSVGANYCEANGAESRNDFEHKIGICRKESKETKYWLRMLVLAEPRMESDIRVLWNEATELSLIFSAIIKTSRANKLKHSIEI